jgi:hypothetical protein
LIRKGEQFIVIEFHDERDFMSILTRNYAQDTQRGGNSIAACFERQLNNVFWVKVDRIGRKGRPS